MKARLAGPSISNMNQKILEQKVNCALSWVISVNTVLLGGPWKLWEFLGPPSEIEANFQQTWFVLALEWQYWTLHLDIGEPEMHNWLFVPKSSEFILFIDKEMVRAKQLFNLQNQFF